MTKRRLIQFVFVYIIIVLARSVTQIPSERWQSFHSTSEALCVIWDNFAKIANQLLGGLSSAGITAFFGWGSSGDPRSPADRVEQPVPAAVQGKSRPTTGIYFRGTFLPETVVIDAITKLKNRIAQLAADQTLVREQVAGNLFRISRLEMFRWSLFCLAAAVVADPLSAVAESVVQRWTSPDAFVHRFAQSLALICLTLVISWIVAKRYYKASGDTGYFAAFIIPTVGLGISGLALVLGVTASPDLSKASGTVRVWVAGHYFLSYFWFLIISRLVILPIAGIAASVFRRMTLPEISSAH